jgi:predicted fused transcriptional regulator/phosphomethylpyrimidine kinase
VEDLAPLLHLQAASLDRAEEAPEARAGEGGTLARGVASVLKPGKPPPDLICDQGGWGREPMVHILGPNPMSVAEKALALKNALQAAGKLK